MQQHGPAGRAQPFQFRGCHLHRDQGGSPGLAQLRHRQQVARGGLHNVGQGVEAGEQRFRRLNAQQPEVAEQLWKDAAADLQKRYDFLAQLAGKAEKSASD